MKIQVRFLRPGGTIALDEDVILVQPQGSGERLRVYFHERLWPIIQKCFPENQPIPYPPEHFDSALITNPVVGMLKDQIHAAGGNLPLLEG